MGQFRPGYILPAAHPDHSSADEHHSRSACQPEPEPESALGFLVRQIIQFQVSIKCLLDFQCHREGEGAQRLVGVLIAHLQGQFGASCLSGGEDKADVAALA